MRESSATRTLGCDRAPLTPPEGDELLHSFERWRYFSPEELCKERQRYTDIEDHGEYTRMLLASLAEFRAGEYAHACRLQMRVFRLTPFTHPFHHRARLMVASVLIRLGEVDRAERMIRRGIGRVSFLTAQPATQLALRSELGRAYLRKGWLSLAAKTLHES